MSKISIIHTKKIESTSKNNAFDALLKFIWICKTQSSEE